MWCIVHDERRECPSEFAARLTEIAGRNRFGGANYRVVWGMTKTTWIGGTWTYLDGTKKKEMRQVLEYGTAAWILEKWFPPENYGSEAVWYRECADPESGLPLLGPYPFEGYYEECYRLTVGGAPIELTDEVVDALVPLIAKANEVSWWIRKAFIEAREEQKAEEWRQKIIDRYTQIVPHTGPISYHGQQNRTARMDRVKLGNVMRKLPKNFGQLN